MGMREATVISERRASLPVNLSRTILYYESKAQPENAVKYLALMQMNQRDRCNDPFGSNLLGAY